MLLPWVVVAPTERGARWRDGVVVEEGLEALRSPGLCVDVDDEGWELVLSFNFLFPPVLVPGPCLVTLILEAGRALLLPAP